MAQVQLATKISIETHFLLDEYSKSSGASKSSIVDAALVDFINRNNLQIKMVEEKVKNTKKTTRGKNGRFQKEG